MTGCGNGAANGCVASAAFLSARVGETVGIIGATTSGFGDPGATGSRTALALRPLSAATSPCICRSPYTITAAGIPIASTAIDAAMRILVFDDIEVLLGPTDVSVGRRTWTLPWVSVVTSSVVVVTTSTLAVSLLAAPYCCSAASIARRRASGRGVGARSLLSDSRSRSVMATVSGLASAQWCAHKKIEAVGRVEGRRDAQRRDGRDQTPRVVMSRAAYAWM